MWGFRRRVSGLGLGLGFRQVKVQGLRSRVWGLGLGLGFRIRFRVWSLPKPQTLNAQVPRGSYPTPFWIPSFMIRICYTEK